MSPSTRGRGSKGDYHLITAPRTSKRSVGWDKLTDLEVASGKSAFVGVFKVHKPSPDRPGCGSANSREDAWERPELPRPWPPDVLGYAPNTAASGSQTLSSPRLTPARLAWEADDIRGAPGSRPPPGRQTGLFIRRKRSPVTLRLHVAFCFPRFPRSRRGCCAYIRSSADGRGGTFRVSPGWALCTCILALSHQGPGPPSLGCLNLPGTLGGKDSV